MTTPADIYRPEQWHDFARQVGGGAAALTGLVFVSMTLNPGALLRDTTHRGRAVAALVTAYVYYRGIFVSHRSGPHSAINPLRVATGSLAFLLQIAGTIWLILGHIAGLYLAAFTMVVYVPYMISGAWLLLVAAHKDAE